MIWGNTESITLLEMHCPSLNNRVNGFRINFAFKKRISSLRTLDIKTKRDCDSQVVRSGIYSELRCLIYIKRQRKVLRHSERILSFWNSTLQAQPSLTSRGDKNAFAAETNRCKYRTILDCHEKMEQFRFVDQQ
ncbi:hypothetical protein TNCV_1088941 [Trichonephila clavipes]|uniref:Uncharacterized protein n=1 Tax=Trichonephila clavipes TaxID=2585209 RepID=A0A8X6T2C9_TRICX|nr:hypothetical protein TNCV_1088941 [Trichonephila clavipes]